MEWIEKLCTQCSRGRIERREDCDWQRMRTKKNKINSRRALDIMMLMM